MTINTIISAAVLTGALVVTTSLVGSLIPKFSACRVKVRRRSNIRRAREK